MYTLGKKVKINIFGKSHGPCVGCILEGIPKGMKIDTEAIEADMALRKPKKGIGTPRKESDNVRIESGVINEKATGSPILLIIDNQNIDDSKYQKFGITPRPGHADLPALVKYHNHDVCGGGQFSGRLTAPIVAAGSIAKQMIGLNGIEIAAFTRSVGEMKDSEERTIGDAFSSRLFQTRACNAELDKKMTEVITNAASDGDSVGGVVECVVDGLPMGFGGIWFEALDSELARAIFGIPAVKGIEFGKGFDLTKMRGSESNDSFIMEDRIRTETNNMGGILGGMSTGMPLVFRTAFKPTPSIAKEQRTVNLEKLCNDTVSVEGRHDPCIVPRAVSVVEAMTALVIADQMMR